MQRSLHHTPKELAALGYADLSPIGETAGILLYRALAPDDERVLIKTPVSVRPPAPVLHQLEHELKIARELNPEFVVRPLKIEMSGGRTALILEDCPYPLLSESLKEPLEVEPFLRIATGIAAALAEVHSAGLVHKDIKPANIFATEGGEAKLTGFGIASKLSRERQAPGPPEVIAGTLSHMAPEQTGRMNRSIDTRSDLYALGVTFYQMLTGQLPFTASDPMEWVHCHIALAPTPPREHVPAIPVPLSDIVMKLMAKAAEERYQTAEGLKADLERCTAEWRERGRIEPFPLGARDVPDRLMIPEKLYGREREVGTLLAAFDRVVASGKPELVLVSGYSGIGKSAVVNELHKALVPSRALFAGGKFDQYKRDIPYATLAQAMQTLVRQVLGRREEETARWREAVLEGVGPNGRLVTDLVPDLVALIGEQPPVAEVPPQDAQNRFNSVFRRFLGVFARPEHPLALFLDDLQWLDAATLHLTEYLMGHPDVRHLLLIGAYRDNEVGPAHPLMAALDSIRRSGASVCPIALGPLAVDDVVRMAADALHCDEEGAGPLADLVYEKTGGNPFFTIQFFTALADEGLVAFDGRTGRWQWDLDRIRAKGYSDNVADLMVGKLNRLRTETREAVKLLACQGSKARLATLVLIREMPEEDVELNLLEAIQAGFLFRQDDSVSFLHDRVQEAAYALIPEKERPQIHLDIGRKLLGQVGAGDIGDILFDVVNHLNRGAVLITDAAEKARLAELDAMAGRRARASIAYETARDFFAAAASLLQEDSWETRYESQFALFLDWAEAEYLRGGFAEAERLFDTLLAHTRSDFDKAAVYELRLKVYQVEGRYDDAVAMGLEALRIFGVEIPEGEDALNRAIQAEAEAVKVELQGRRIEDLPYAEEARDPRVRAVIGLLSNTAPAAYIGNRPQLFPLIALLLVRYSLSFGPTKESCHGYSAYGLMLASLFDAPHAGYAFSDAAIKLSERFNALPLTGLTWISHQTVPKDAQQSSAPCAAFCRRPTGDRIRHRKWRVGQVRRCILCCWRSGDGRAVSGRHVSEAAVSEREHIFPRKGRSNGNFDTPHAHRHQSADLEQFRTDGSGRGVLKFGVPQA